MSGLTRLGSISLLALVAIVVGCGAPADVGDEEQDREPITEVSEELTAEMSRGEIMALAQTGVGYSYWWGHGAWDPTQKTYPGKCKGSCPGCSHWASPSGGPEFGADCSGYVSQVWQVPTAGSPKTNRHPYSTYNFRYQKTHWDPIKKSEIQQGDALVYNTGGKGHIMLFDKWSGGGKAVVYECAGCSIGCVHRSRSVGSQYIAIRRRGLENAPANKAPKGYLDGASCNGGIRGWARDPDSGKTPIDVVLSFGGPIGKSTGAEITVKADLHRDDLCKRLGSCKHAFDVEVPASLRDGKKHSVYAYGVDPKSGEKKLLVGAPRTFSCAGTSQVAPSPTVCGHGMCQQGAPLSPKCSPCANAVCVKRPSCCDQNGGAWDAECVKLAGDTPGACAGVCYNGSSSCSHHECVDGAALPTSCSTCAASVCERDAFCCNNKWDWICASEAKKDAYCLCQ